MGNFQKTATQFENNVASDLWKETDEHTIIRAGYSGNSVMPLPDIFVRSKDKYWDTGLELKRTSTSGRQEIAIEREDVYQLFKFCIRNPADTNGVFGLKFPSREPCLVSLPYYSDDKKSKVYDRLVEQFEKKDGIDYRETNKDKITVEKPSLDNWNSARSGNDMAESILDILP